MNSLKPALIIIVFVTLARFALSGELELAEDEAYYWMWSQQLDSGYFDHPPAIAWLIRAGTEVLGDTEQGVRLGCILLGALIPILCALAPNSEENRGDRALRSAVILSFLPLFALGGLLATPDVPLCAAWAFGIWAAARERSGLLGLAAGLAMLSKYTGVLLLPLLFIAEPRRIKERGSWLAVGVATLIYSPNAIWNLRHDLVSWHFQLDHATSGGSSLDFLGAQVALVSPLLFCVFLAWWCVGWRGGRLERLCWWTSVPVLALALLSGGEANWAAPAYVSTVVGLGCRAGRWRRASWASSVLAIGLSLIFLIHLVHPLFGIQGDPRARLHGGKILGESVAAWGIPVVATSRYQEAGLISFYGGVKAVALPDHGRPDQFDIWETALPDRTLYIRVWDKDRMPAIETRGYHSRGSNDVSAFMPGPDPGNDRLVQRWQVYEVVREESP